VPNIINTFAGTGAASYIGDGSSARLAALYTPKNVAVDAAGNLYIADYSNHRIRKINTSGIISTFAGNGTAGYSGDGGAATASEISYPWGVAVDGSGNIYIADSFVVRKVNSSGIISTVAGTGLPGYTGDGGAATAATMNGAEGIALDAFGNLYIAEVNNNCVRMVNTAGTISTIAGNGTAANTGDGSPATASELYNPRSVTVDNLGNIYIGVSGSRVRKINTSGTISTFASSGLSGATVYSLYTDNSGNVYVSDSGYVQKVNPYGSITTLAGNGSCCFSGTGGMATAAAINKVTYCTGDGAGDFFISCDSENVIRKVSPDTKMRFMGGDVQSFGVCVGSGGNPLNTVLAVDDIDSGEYLTWNYVRLPLHGTLVYYYSTTSTGGVVTPSGLYYSPSGTYIGVDTFKVKVSGSAGLSDTTTVCVVIVLAPSLATITGGPDVCIGQTLALWDTLGGGIWSSSNPSIASIGSAWSIVSGNSFGSVTISYTRYMSCGTATAITTLNVVSSPVSISGTFAECPGATTTLVDSTASGAWFSGNTSVATIGSSSGILAGVSAGVAVISYMLSSGCMNTTQVTINPIPPVPRATGVSPLKVCVGSSISLTDSLTGGTWAAAGSSATVGSTSGVLTGVSPGAILINYTLPTGCNQVAMVTVNALPSAITGTVNECVGVTTIISDTASGGAWGSSNSSIATVGSAGGVTGVAAGTTNISYTIPGGCAATRTVTINPLPTAISGSAIVCSAPTALSDSVTGGLWSTGGSVAAIGSATGIVTGLTLGTETITYTLPTGCAATKAVTVSMTPSVITGTAILCTGSTVTLADSVSGGAWSSSNTAIAIAGSTGIVSGVSGGTAIITYTLPAGCAATKSVTVNPLPATITGSLNICSGASTHLGDSLTGGAWSTGSSATASVGTTGIVTGAATGTAMITYTMPSGCLTAIQITVNQLPSAITGINHLCIGQSTSLNDSVSGGNWSSANNAIATIGSTTGLVGGVASGTVMMTYALPTGCMAAKTVSVNSLPSAIISPTGYFYLCQGTALSMYDGSGGGAWTGGAAGIATIGTTGAITGISAGTAPITYTLPTGCTATVNVTVDPTPAAITGTPDICIALSSVLSDSITGGTWSASNPLAYVNPATGVVIGVATGSDTISYTISPASYLPGCTTTMIVTVNPAPVAVMGASQVCAGATGLLHDGVSGGIWSSGSAGIASIGSVTGIVTGVAPGSATISYSTGTGCTVNFPVTVTPVPSAILGLASVCQGAAITLADTTTGGIWSSAASTGTVTIGSASGIVTGIGSGTAVINYTIAPATGALGCSATRTIIVDPLPATITGTLHVCPGSTTILASGSGGVWSAGATAIATAGSASGVVTGVVPGTTTVTYTLPTGCAVSAIITVNHLPSSITGASAVCVGLSTTLSDSATGGNWTKSNSNVNIGFSSGTLTGIISGTTVITYTVPATGCFVTKTVSVTPSPGAISGLTRVCEGAATMLSDPITGGTWTSSNTGVAVIGSSSGMLTGITPGPVTITYSLGLGCNVSTIITVNPLPPVITGTMYECVGAATTLSDSAGSGIWSTAGATASVGSATGIVTGVSGGVAVITYTTGAASSFPGCSRTAMVTVNPSPPAIAGPSAVCVGSAILLIDGTGGVWSSSNTAIATIGSSTGVVSGDTIGVTTIGYTLASTGCVTNTTVTVSLSPTAITGPSAVCAGATIVLGDPVGGGLWSSASAGIATVGSAGSLSGIVSGIAGGASTTITYSLGTGCTVTKTVTVITAPAAITGTMSLCAGTNATLADSTGGGTWSSMASSLFTVSPAGVVHGVSAGTATVSYIAAGTGCPATATITIDPVPADIMGFSSVCTGAAIMEIDTTAGGTWSSPAGSLTVDSTGVITGVSAGVSVITYSSGSCTATKTITVNALPVITGAMGLCEGASSTLSAGTGGTWSSSAGSLLTVGSASGIVTAGVVTGTANITFTPPSGCTAIATVTVNSGPSAITGPTHVCTGATTDLGDPAGGGTWSITPATTAFVGSSTGIVTGIAPGVATVTYSLGSGCMVGAMVTVNASPAGITGMPQVCVDATTLFSTASTGGYWTSSPAGIAIVGASGIVTGVSAGIATISYTIGAPGCPAIKEVTVNAAPSAITGAVRVCVGSTAALTDTSGTGVWSSPSTGITAVDSVTGIVTGIGVGTGTISYTTPDGCTAFKPVTVNPVPDPVTGALSICIYSSTTLSDLTSGGTWSTGSASYGIVTVATATGVISGIGLGTAMISYNVAGCFAVAEVTVNSLPAAISGSSNVCFGETDTLTDLPGGGIWSSSNVLVASVGSAGLPSSAGVVLGVAPGTATIIYSLGVGCTVGVTVTVHPAPPAISVPAGGGVCVGLTTSLSDITGGGAWSSGDTLVATISSTGVVTGRSGGAAPISYTVPIATGLRCAAITSITVNTVPAIEGIRNMCAFDTLHLSDSITGGAWTSTLVSVSAGIVTSYIPGVATIIYTLGDGCAASALLTVNPLPAPVTVSGATHLCVGHTVSLNDITPGGRWSSGDVSVATIGSAGSLSGLVTAMGAGTAAMHYTILATGCSETVTVTVNAFPSAGTISGFAGVCTGATITVADTIPGGAWSSGSTATIVPGSLSAVVTGISVGMDTIKYEVTNICGSASATKTITIDSLPRAGTISGIDSVCAGASVNIANSVPGGTWSASNADAAIDSAGVLTGMLSGVSPGADTISYSIANSCGTASTTFAVAVDPLPQTGTITGQQSVCTGEADTLTGAPGGGVWSSESANAIVNNGIVTGVSAGVDTIRYSFTNSCGTNTTGYAITINKCDTVTGIANVQMNKYANVEIYPNPAKGELNVENATNNELHIYDLLGKEVYHTALISDNEQINIKGLPDGVYVVEIVDVTGMKTIRKIVKE